MATSEKRARRFRYFAVIVVAAYLVALALAIHFSSFAGLPIVLLFAALILVAENGQVDLPTNLTISPHVLLVMATLTALDRRGVVIGTALAGAAGGVVISNLRRRHFAAVAFNIAQFGLSSAAAGATAVLCYHNNVPALQT